MTRTTATTEEPILSRLDRLDIMLRQLEEIKGCNTVPRSSPSAKSSSASTPSSGTLTSDYGQVSSSSAVSPKSIEKHCRPIEDVMMEKEAKGTLIERLDHVEDRVLKLCVQLEYELDAAERKRDDRVKVGEEERTPHKKKGLKQLVKQCVTGKKN